MEELLKFFGTYGWPLTGIAVLGIIVLGVLKYCNVFKNLSEQNRHYLYLGISIAIALIGATIYLLVINQFDWAYMTAYAGAVYVLNQAFYNIFKVTKLNDLGTKILDIVKKLLTVFNNKETK